TELPVPVGVGADTFGLIHSRLISGVGRLFAYRVRPSSLSGVFTLSVLPCPRKGFYWPAFGVWQLNTHYRPSQPLCQNALTFLPWHTDRCTNADRFNPLQFCEN